MDTVPFEFAREGCLLSSATCYEVGGPARLVLEPRSIDEAVEGYAWLRSQPGPWLILGKGSNVLISDDGFPGIVLLTTALTAIENLGGDRYRVETGVELGKLVSEVMVRNNYEGTGALAGIPGSVGGAIFMNAGTVNGTTCQFLESVVLATLDGVKRVGVDTSQYGYRGQSFCAPDELILESVFRFSRCKEDQRAVYAHYIQRRKEKQPEGACCGSVFKNPPNDHAGRLIEACGLKGTRRGGAVISPKHANFIMNEANATFEDIIGLMDLCKREVRRRFGIELEEEVRIIRSA